MADFMVLTLELNHARQWQCDDWMTGTAPNAVDVLCAEAAGDPRWWCVARIVGGLA